MKQSVVKTLGVAALGAAFAAAGAGAANAAPAPKAAPALDSAARTLPAKNVKLPAAKSIAKNPTAPGGQGLLGGLPVKLPVGLPL